MAKKQDQRKEATQDTAPAVRTEPKTTFSERTSAVQPWAEYQEEAEAKAAQAAKEDSTATA